MPFKRSATIRHLSRSVRVIIASRRKRGRETRRPVETGGWKQGEEGSKEDTSQPAATLPGSRACFRARATRPSHWVPARPPLQRMLLHRPVFLEVSLRVSAAVIAWHIRTRIRQFTNGLGHHALPAQLVHLGWILSLGLTRDKETEAKEEHKLQRACDCTS